MKSNERIVRYTAAELDEMHRRGETETDWERVRNLTYEEIEASVDFEDEGTFDLDLAFKGLPGPSEEITVRFDTVMIDWFKAQGPGYEIRMNAVLRQYMDRKTSAQSSE